MRWKKKKSRLSQAMVFLILFGIVSLFSDMTHEGASSIRGAYLALLELPPEPSGSSPVWGNSSAILCATSSDASPTAPAATGP
ncbi:MAG: hypothetical protein V8Q30_09455 [Acutalibacteraceae bacterium]